MTYLKRAFSFPRGEPDRRPVRDMSFYRRRDGSPNKIEARWNTTMHDTSENRADTSNGIDLRTGIGVMNSPGCRQIEFHSFVVGTKSFILTGYPPKMREAMLEAVQRVCGTGQGRHWVAESCPPNSALERPGVKAPGASESASAGRSATIR